MAYRDRSQAVAFIYENPLKLLKAFDEGNQKKAIAVGLHTHRKIAAERSHAINVATERLKSNLKRLEEMQSKVHFMIKELEKTSGKPKPKK